MKTALRSTGILSQRQNARTINVVLQIPAVILSIVQIRQRPGLISPNIPLQMGDNPLPEKLEIRIDPDHISDPVYIRREVERRAGRRFDTFRILRRSVDARRSRPLFLLQIELDPKPLDPDFRFAPVPAHPAVIIVGSGPAGLFAALELIRLGIKPILLERGAKVEKRRKSIAMLLRRGELDPKANYCFGEGGAGAFSDGKLYTRATKRGDIGQLLRLLVFHGASPDILIDAHPHIGSDKLPTVIRNIRETIVACGGEVHFETRVEDLLMDHGFVRGVRLTDGTPLRTRAVILAVGHSARDIVQKLHEQGIVLQAKPLAVGVRVEHPQALIDAIQYHHRPRHPNLPPATYRMARQSQGRGVYSFCMCPGGMIVPTATREGELAVNGMSFSGRRGQFANAGIVVEMRTEDLEEPHRHSPFGFLALQQQLERRAFEMAGAGGRQAPAQRMKDFLEGRVSSTLPASSYRQGLVSSPLHELFPPAVVSRLRDALNTFDRRLKGFISAEALLVAIESRTSSPVRIPRDPRTLMHPQASGLFPCGEGAGYAGGITSSAMDGQLAARRVADYVKNS